MFNKKLRQKIGTLVVISQLFSALTPLLTLAAPQSVSGTDTQNAIDTVGTKANRLKTQGSSGVDESTGAFTYSYPLQVPKGKNGMEPNLAINYNSQSSENGIFGYGMSMQIPYIERTARFGVDKIYTKSDFVSSTGGELILSPNSSNQYIQKIDDGSYQLYTFVNNVWTLTDRSGNIYTFGATLDSRFSDESGGKIQKYYLTSVKDTLGNQMKYFYEKKNGFVYPKEIDYTIDRFSTFSNKVIFEREARNDSDISYKSGFRVTMDDRVKTIKMYTDNVVVGQIDLTYVSGQNGNRSLLSTITESRMGTDGVMTSLPATQLTYEKTTSLSFQSGSKGIMYSTTNPNNITNIIYMDMNGDGKLENTDLRVSYERNAPNYMFIDANGDGLMDKVASYFWNGYSAVAGDNYLKNSYSGFTTIPRTNIGIAALGTVMDTNGDGLSDIVNGSTIYQNSGEKFATLNGVNYPTDTMQYGDFNGDGLVDIVKKYTASSTASTTPFVFLNNGNGWNSTPDFIFPTFSKVLYSNGSEVDTGIVVGDVNGDGLDDVFRSYYSDQWKDNYQNYILAPVGSYQDIFVNNGKGFATTTSITLNNYTVQYSTGGYWNGPWWPDREEYTTYKTMWDENSDGVMDIGGGTANFKKQDVLKTVTSPLGGKTDVTYKGSATGNNSKLPLNILVVDQLKTTDTKNNLVTTVQYSFENGKMYFDPNNTYDRRFAGFGKVTTADMTASSSQKTIKYFHQGDGDDASLNERGDSFYNIGRTYREELWGKNSSNVDTKYSDSYKQYGVYQYGGQTYSYIKQEVNTTYDDAGGKLAKATTYDYDLTSRLPKKVTDFGAVSFASSTGVISDSGEDGIVTTNIYNTQRPQKLLSTEVKDMNGKFLDKKVYFYDELPFGYVERGLLTESRNYSSNNNYVRTTNVYYDSGLLNTSSDNNGNTTTYTYDANNNPETVTNPLNQTTTNETNKWLGVVTKTTDPNGKIVQTVYDGFGRVKSVSGSVPSGSTATLSTKSYSYSTGMTETINIFKDGSVYKTLTNSYDTLGRVVSGVETVGSSAKQIDYTYNNLGQLVSISYPYDANGILGSYNSSINTVYTYDSLGRLISTSQGGLTNYNTYLVNGKTTSDNTTEGHFKTYTYNTQDKIVSVKERNASSTYETKYSWNQLGNLIGIIDAEGNVRNFNYDGEGRLLRQEDLHKNADNTYGVYTYTYDAIGNMLSKTDPSMNKFSYAYDNLYRPITETIGGKTTTYTYDSCTNGKGKVCSIANNDYTQNLTYKLTGDTSTESKIMDGKTFINTYAYDSLGQVTSITLPDTSVISYTYDNNGKQKTATLTSADNKTTNFVTDAKYNIDGTLSNITYGNGTKSCYNYSTSNGVTSAPRLSDIYTFVGTDCSNASSTSPSSLYAENLVYNKGGSIISNTEKYANDTGNIVSTFTYDELNRLTASNVLQNSLNVVNNISYSPIGNILSSDSINYSYGTTGYANPNAPTTIGSKSVTYDPNGNVLTDGKNMYNWNEKNTLSKQENDRSISQYTYDIAGERIKETIKVKGSATETSQYSVNESTYNSFTQATTTKIDTYVSEATFNQLSTANLLSENKVSMLFALAYETGYPQKVCVGSMDPNCQKAGAEKFVGAYLLSKYNITLTNTSLEEIYSVYLGQLLIGNSSADYTKDLLGNYISRVNATSSIIAVLSTTTVALEIASTTVNKTLYGYVYKENKIPSLFGSPRLISKETFAELQNLGITYTNIIIYDRLINYSFTPYASCNSLYGDVQNDCKKTILVKYLFAISKYEKGQELSSIALDEMAEVVAGNLTVPNNTDEYYIYEIKNISTNNTYSTAQWAQQYYPSLSSSISGCGVGYFTGSVSGSGFTSYNRCLSTFNLPTEMATRSKEVSKIEIENFSAAGNINGLKTYLNTSNPYQTTYPYPATSDVNTGVSEIFSTTAFDYAAGSTLNLDVTNSLLPWVQGKASSTGLRFFSDMSNSNPNGIQINTTGSTLKVTFKKDADQILRAYETPLVTNPKDPAIEANVLSVLARVDKNYGTNISTIVSKETFNELANINIFNNTDLINLVSQNEKLQKDDTLAAVFTYVKNNYSNYQLSREALEEIFLVYTGKLSMPYDTVQYNYASATTTRTIYEKAAWNFYSENSTSSATTTNSCVTNSNSKCYLKLPDVDKPYINVSTVNLTLTGTGGYNNTISLSAITNPFTGSLSGVTLSTTTVTGNFVNAPLTLNLTNYYTAYANGLFTKNGFLITSNNFSVSDLTQLISVNTYVEVTSTPKFTIFDRSKLENLSVVPGVSSYRSLQDKDIITNNMLISTSTRAELTMASITAKTDIFPFITNMGSVTASTTITRAQKLSVLGNIFNNVKAVKNVSLSREALEEMYYVMNNLLYFTGTSTQELMTDNFDRADSSLVGGNWTDNTDNGDNLKIYGNALNMKWASQATYQFKSAYQNLSQQNNVSISYKWKTMSGATVDGYYPYVGVRSNGNNDITSSFGVAVFYIPQNGKLYAHFLNNGSLLKETQIFATTPTNTDFNIEINIDSSNFIEFRMWQVGQSRPASSTAFFNNNGGSAYTPSASGNKIIIGTLDGSSAPNSVNTFVDDFKVSVLGGGGGATLPIFDRSTFGVLDPVDTTVSANETKISENINYNLTENQIKIVSDDTRGELGFVGITTRQQILDIMAKTPATLKDSKMHFFKEYIAENKGFVLSRAALEEIYLIYMAKEVFIDGTNIPNISTTTDIYSSTNTNWQMVNRPSNVSGPTNCEAGVTSTGNSNAFSQTNLYCDIALTIPEKYGYVLKSATLSYSYSNSNIVVSANGNPVPESGSSGSINITPYIASSTYAVLKIGSRYTGTFTTYSNPITNLKVTTVYEIVKDKLDRNTFASLSDTSSYDELKNSLTKELTALNFVNSVPTSTTVFNISTDTQIEIASSTLATVNDVKNIFTMASSSWVKESKLYYFFLKIKQLSNIELTRAALEEMWNVNNNTETIASTTQSSLPANTSVIFNADGYTQVCTREGRDIQNNPITSNPYTWKRTGVYFASSENSTSTYRPKLTVAYTNLTTGVSATTTFNSMSNDVSVENNTYPGAWSTIRSETTGRNGDFPDGQPIFGTYSGFYAPSTGYQSIVRGLVMFDTRSIPSNSYISQATLALTPTYVVNDYPDFADYISVYKPTTSSTTAFVLSDYSKCGTPLGSPTNDLASKTLSTMSANTTSNFNIITGTSTSASTTLSRFDRASSTFATYIANSTMDMLMAAYASSTGIATSTFATIITTPNFCNSVLQDCGVPATSTATTTIQTLATSTQVTDSTPTCSITNPYSYPYIVDGSCNPTFFLPNGATTTDGTTIVYNTLAKNMKDWNINANVSSNDSVYVKYYPSQNYEYDNRGINVINVFFNGKLVGSYKYNDVKTLSETSYVHNNYQGSPVVISTSDGTVTEVIKTDAWGSQISDSYDSNAVIPSSFGFTGHKFDRDSSLTYAHARFLNNQNKVWLSNDPMSISGFNSDYFLVNPQFQNSYSYGGNNPVNNVDPDGKAVYVYTKVTEANPYGTHSFLYIEPDNPNDFDKNMYSSNGKGWTYTGGVADNKPGLLQAFHNDSSDMNVVTYGYGRPDSTPAVGPTTGKYPMRERALVPTPEGMTDSEFIKAIKKEFDAYQNDAQYSFDAHGGYNCNVFETTLLKNAGAKKLPYNGRDLPGLAPGFGQLIPSNYIKYDPKNPGGSGLPAGMIRTVTGEAGIKVQNAYSGFVSVVGGLWNKTLGR